MAKPPDRYMSGPKADAILARIGDPSIKKRKKKPKNEDYTSKLEKGEGLMMRDEDEWNRGNGEDVDITATGDEDAPGQCSTTLQNQLVEGADPTPVVGKALATFNKSKSTWSTVGSTSLPMASQPQEAGPSTLSPAAGEEEDIKPDIDQQPKKAVTKRKGGLRTAAQMREEAEALKAEQAAAAAAAAEAAGDTGEGSTAVAPAPGQSQTVHRDSSGRIVDIEKLKREARDKEDEERRKAREREEWSKGLVQRQKQQDRAREEAEMGRNDVARYVQLQPSMPPAPTDVWQVRE